MTSEMSLFKLVTVMIWTLWAHASQFLFCEGAANLGYEMFE